ncbi:DUF6268 family outer membrane beta-barrel protein [Lacinutrix sp. MedPE-SW]|uniref:DUF6268 family outer membrane beta-barrel protein n=1 Tax=Lacinutrix sp. MedPE-SW TaxID=1860087 RepID=UPI000913A7F6|nr:DUF6268 family outer membrane beta-barrel protein [Lacinutrix sp. MedPE-SW]OIQ19403.1 MAG: hypothetical protein BM549_10695 [Lacinutrix sp. MedPE-SW]
MLKLKFKNYILIILIITSIQTVSAQLTDLARIEYSYIPKKNSEDSFKRFRTLINYPIELKEDTYLIVGGEYSNIDFDIEDHYPFSTENLSRLHVIDFNLGYTFKVSEKWRLGAKISPRIASTLREKISGDDIFINGGVYAINDRTKDESVKKPYRLIVGLTYNSTAGIPLPLPFVSYFRRVNKNWSFNLGVPKTNVKYFFDEKNIVQLYTSIDGYFANIQNPIFIDNKEADSISLSVVISGLGYEHYFTKHLVWYAYTGYTLSMNNRLRDSDREEVFKLDNVNTFYFRSGIKFKI